MDDLILLKDFDPLLKEEWVTALESGNYIQGIGSLKNSMGQYCCLGVLGCLLIKKNPERYSFIGVVFEDSLSLERGENTLPEGVSSDINLPSIIQDYLASLNDSHYSFGNIANWIRMNV
jgi:hypothetical protein